MEAMNASLASADLQEGLVSEDRSQHSAPSSRWEEPSARPLMLSFNLVFRVTIVA